MRTRSTWRPPTRSTGVSSWTVLWQQVRMHGPVLDITPKTKSTQSSSSHVLKCEVTWAEQSFLGQALSAFLAEAVINIYLAIWRPAVSIRRFKPQPNTRAGCKNLFAGGKQRGSCKTQPDKHSPQPLELLVKICLIPLPSTSSLLGNKASPRILSIRKIEDVLNSTPCRCLMPLTDWTKTTGCNH